MSFPFPNICPQRRSITAGKYPVKRFTAYSGASTTRLYGDKPFEARMRLGYLLGDEEMAEFLKSYHDSKGGAGVLVLPASVYGGIDPVLRAQIKSYSWRWDAPPQLESLNSGLSRIQVSLIGTLDA